MQGSIHVKAVCFLYWRCLARCASPTSDFVTHDCVAGSEVSVLEQILTELLEHEPTEDARKWIETCAQLMLCRNLVLPVRRILNSSQFNEMSLQLFKCE